MIKKSVLQKIIKRDVPNLIDEKLEPLGFKYFKSKKLFIKKKNDIAWHIRLSDQQSKLIFLKENEPPVIRFSIAGIVKFTKFENWYYSKFEDHPRIGGIASSYKCYITAQEIDFQENAFFEPSPSRLFKSNIINSLGSNEPQKLISLNSFVKDELNVMLSDMRKLSDPKEYFDNSKYPLSLIYFMHYYHFKEISNRLIKQLYSLELENIKNENNNKSSILSFQKFIQKVKILNGEILFDPFSIPVKKLESKNELRIVIDKKAEFKEVGRYGIENIKCKNYSISQNGILLIVANDNRIIILDRNGNIIKDQKLPIQDNFSDFINIELVKYIADIDSFLVNNTRITLSGDAIIYKLPESEKKLKYKQHSDIKDVQYWNNLIYIIYHQSLLIYDINGNLKNKIEYEDKLVKLIIEKEWVTSINKIYDFKSNEIFKYEVGNGNDQQTLSTKKDVIVYHGYSTKSQYYKFGEKKKTLWAHPTYKKQYKELLYSDTHHNFDLYKLCFSPDDEIMVGAGYHGKYVAWESNSLARHELIPNTEVINLLNKYTRSERVGDTWNEIEIKPEIVEIDNEKYLKNRGNSVDNIFFIRNGKYFIMSLGNTGILTLWNRNFENIGSERTNGNIKIHNSNYISESNEKEIIIFKRITDTNPR